MSQTYIQNEAICSCGCHASKDRSQTMNEIFANSCPDVKEDLTEMRVLYLNTREKVIARILNHRKDAFTESELQTMKLHELEGIAGMIPDAASSRIPPNFSGQGQPQPTIQNSAGLLVPSMGYENAPQLTANSAGLSLPTMNFSPAADVRSNASRQGNLDSGRRPTANRMSGASRQAETAAGLPLPSMDY